ncbi:hypothetical protein [Pedobacter steynii]|uniref:Uncharacterized protein n=1 Tax=Pedobacter steynii TaxID=430522 RepID=A0A1D7QBT7_9SPHI|nr:hypothetical protein [Pedobacter steynii]AOM76141.1 hypothetical protein BFS30_02535 [Pedobacter steynii]
MKKYASACRLFISDKLMQFHTQKKYVNETIISIPLTNSNEYAYDSFITAKPSLGVLENL